MKVPETVVKVFDLEEESSPQELPPIGAIRNNESPKLDSPGMLANRIPEIINEESIESNVIQSDPDEEDKVNDVLTERVKRRNFSDERLIKQDMIDIEEESIRLDEFIKGNPNSNVGNFSFDMSKLPPHIAEKLK